MQRDRNEYEQQRRARTRTGNHGDHGEEVRIDESCIAHASSVHFHADGATT
jgi:hypothetical protein